MTNPDVQADILLKEAALRQGLVDRLLARSAWGEHAARGLVTLPAVAGALFVWSVWAFGREGSSHAFVSGALILVFWLSVALVDVAGRLRVLTKILERSGVLDQFIEKQTKHPHPPSARSDNQQPRG